MFAPGPLETSSMVLGREKGFGTATAILERYKKLTLPEAAGI